MRTSKISQDTTRIFHALSPNTRVSRTTRSARAAKGISSFALGYDGSIEVKDEPIERSDGESVISASVDIEDALSLPVHSKKRKRGSDKPGATAASTTKLESAWASPGKRPLKEEDMSDTNSSRGRVKAKPKLPARKTTLEDGTVKIHPPSNWEEIYDIVKRMRAANPTAPVDTMGCEDLFWEPSSPKQRRYETLTALMLSSQTKDTVTAVAMHRLHTELVPQELGSDGRLPPSSLTVSNILACDPTHLDSLIGKVGFHTKKTAYIKAAAEMLRSEYNSDIPDTVEGLMRLPGVGPKMAYLCMSAAWGIDLGIGVDVHVHRITNLWGWHSTKNPEETRHWLEGWLPKDRWHPINKLLVGLGQTVCLPVGRKCGECDLAGRGLCKSEIRGSKVTEKRVKVGRTKNGEDEKVVVKSERYIEIKEELADP